ncbi:MAG: GPR endopeptidase [Oscillospiraceae bacterium]|nr:GPR endopeptidase [Oscillospiraceae bacterium]
MGKRTDLAVEAREIWQESAGKTTKLPGVRARSWSGQGLTLTKVEVLDHRGERALQKPVGSYVTLEWKKDLIRDPSGFTRAAVCLGKELGRMLPKTGSVLVAGLGNGNVTPDAVGPRAMDHLVVTRHLGRSFPQLRSVSAIAPGVLGTTGLESAEVVRGIVERSAPCCVVVVDALASREPGRVCATVQLTDTGITPGSGVGNHRMAFDRESLGVPVVAVGVPTVVEAATLLQDAIEENVGKHGNIKTNCDRSMIVTPRDIDARVNTLARLLGYGISLALHRGLTVSDISCFVG